MSKSDTKVCEIKKKLLSKAEMPIGGDILTAGSSKLYLTGNWRTFTPEIDEKKCIHCMICTQFCPEHCIPQTNGKRGKVNLDYCKGCGICSEECPVKCITMKKPE